MRLSIMFSHTDRGGGTMTEFFVKEKGKIRRWNFEGSFFVMFVVGFPWFLLWCLWYAAN